MNKGKLVLKGKIKLLSPLIIGGGEDEESDIDVIKDKQGNPFIPATSLIGILRHFVTGNEINSDELKRFWGYSKEKNTIGSSVSCSDLDLVLNTESNIVIRDGVKIDNKTGRAEDKGKYDYEVIEPGAEFNLKLIADYSDDNQKVFARKMFGSIIHYLSNSEISLGAKTNNGLGKVTLSESYVFDYDFNEKKNVIAWLSNKETDKIKITERFDIIKKQFTINAYFDLKTSVIIKSYPTDPKLPDSVNIKSGGINVIPGTSIKGAIRSRAEKILNTKSKPEILSKNLFGFVDENDTDSTAIKSKLRIEETTLDNEKFAEEIQSRIKIDRFTGGTIAGKLFDSMPLFRNKKDGKEKVINIKMSINDFEDHEAGLLLLVLKDLWSGDLPLGGEKNVGRGVLEGVCAEISDGKEMNIEIDDPKNLKQYDKDILQNFVKALNEYEVKNG
jgi:CRISPR/Cas system CSM-associated protein Csm3 (group 7 of RAMP superfamily)